MRQIFLKNPSKLAKFDLAFSLGKTVAELDATLSQREFLEWIAYLKMEPRGSRREDYRNGWLILNMFRLMGNKNLTIEDTKVKFDDPKKAIKDPEKINKQNAMAMQFITKRGPDKTVPSRKELRK